MTNEETRFKLVTQLIEGLIDDPRSLELTTLSFPRRVNWRAKVSINDTGKVIGKKASHLHSLRAVIALMGARYQEDWKLAVEDPDDGERADKPRIPRSENIDIAPATMFLTAIMQAVLVDPTPITAELLGDNSEYRFTILPQSDADYERLATAVPVGVGQALTPIAGLGTLYRAYGRQQGAHFTINLPGK